jgi:hypothetical protein
MRFVDHLSRHRWVPSFGPAEISPGLCRCKAEKSGA